MSSLFRVIACVDDKRVALTPTQLRRFAAAGGAAMRVLHLVLFRKRPRAQAEATVVSRHGKARKRRTGGGTAIEAEHGSN